MPYTLVFGLLPINSHIFIKLSNIPIFYGIFMAEHTCEARLPYINEMWSEKKKYQGGRRRHDKNNIKTKYQVTRGSAEARGRRAWVSGTNSGRGKGSRATRVVRWLGPVAEVAAPVPRRTKDQFRGWGTCGDEPGDVVLESVNRGIWTCEIIYIAI